jgi:hypothetical protein
MIAAGASAAVRRWAWLIVLTILALAVMSLPDLLMPASRQQPLMLVVQVLISGAILGLGRQGIDVLLVRIAAASIGLLLTSLPPSCTGGLDCSRAVVLGLIGFGILGSMLLSMIALPVNVLWNRGMSGLAPEVLHLLPHPRRWWQWILLIALIGLGLVALEVFLGGSGAP